MTRYSLAPLSDPAVEPVSLAEVKARTRVDFADDDALLSAYIATARRWLDAADGYLGRALITQSWTLRLDRFTNSILIPLPPCQAILAVRYVDLAGTLQTLAPSNYAVFGLGTDMGARLMAARTTSWPPTIDEPQCVEIDFRAGYGDAASDVPEPIREAIMVRVAQLYDNRETPPAPPVELVQGYRSFTF